MSKIPLILFVCGQDFTELSFHKRESRIIIVRDVKLPAQLYITLSQGMSKEKQLGKFQLLSDVKDDGSIRVERGKSLQD